MKSSGHNPPYRAGSPARHVASRRGLPRLSGVFRLRRVLRV